jgi:spore maturation protein CgeB
LASRTKDHADFFEEGKEIFLFSDAKEAASKWYLIQEISVQDFQKGINSAQNKLRLMHSYAARIDFLLNGLDQLL